MKLHKKIGHWLIDYGYMIRGGATSLIYRNPPAHYLGHVVSGKIPVILIPGILGKWSFMKHLGDKISLEGHPVYIVRQLGYNIYSIPTSARKLKVLIQHILPKIGHAIPKLWLGAQNIEKLIKEQNLKRVVLVAHSKGGLIGKYFLVHNNNEHTVLGMIAVATPFSGSAMAKLVPHDSFRELLTDSKIIRDLEQHTNVNHQIVSIIPEYDNHVWAEKGSFLDGAKNIEVPVHGHHKVIFDKTVVEIILAELEKISNNT